MARAAGYSEEDLEVLEAEFTQLIQRSIERVCAAVADQLHGTITAAHVFHLPGKHDQKTHGRSRQRDIKVIPPGGGGGQWQSSSDIDVRTNNLWAESRDGQRAIVHTMRNMHQGKLDATEGAELETPWMNVYANAMDFSTGERYGTDALRDDVFNAASRLDARLEDAPVVRTPLHRGMRVVDPAGTFPVGGQFDSDVSSWTMHESHAREYASHVTFSGQSTMMHIAGGSRGVNLDDGSLGAQSGNGEHLLRGTFKITGTRTDEGGIFHVDVEQLWLPS